MLIMGIPNVGKSTLMNRLCKRRVTQVDDEPAVTKTQQRHKLNDHTAIIDSPGLLWGTIKDPHVSASCLRRSTLWATQSSMTKGSPNFSPPSFFHAILPDSQPATVLLWRDSRGRA